MRRIIRSLLTALLTGGALWSCSTDPEGPVLGAVIVGSQASPTDIAPEQGHLELREDR
jgi:hypothetical protein